MDNVSDGFFAATSLDEKLSNAGAEMFFRFERCVLEFRPIVMSTA